MQASRRVDTWVLLVGLVTVLAAAPNGLNQSYAQGAPPVQAGAEAASSDLAGIAHIALRVHDLAASTVFYEKLGFVRAFALSRDGAVYEAFLKINDRQFIELYPATEKDTQVGFLHLCFEASHLQAVHDFYVSQGLAPIDVRKAGAGNLLFTMPGPATSNGPQNIEYTEYMPGSLHTRDAGRHLSGSRIAGEIASVTLGFSDPAAARVFYADKLRFSPAPGVGHRLVLPGATGESVQIEPGEALGTQARFTLRTSVGQVADLLTKRGVAFSKDGDMLSVSDPDGNLILFEASQNKP